MKVATDIGGTFTDLVAIDESGGLILEKAHTTPPNFDQGVMDVLEKSGVNMSGIDAFFPRHHDDHQRSDGAQGREDGPHHHQGLPRHSGARALQPPRPLQSRV